MIQEDALIIPAKSVAVGGQNHQLRRYMIVADDKGLNKNNNLQGLEKTAPVSVVIPAYNCAATILDAIDSITSQTVMPFELIVVDDASNDDTKEVVLNIQKKLKPG